MGSNVEIDRLSSLPDDLVHKILSFVGIKCSIQTSLLSPRWRFVWTSMPYLNFSSGDFLTLPKFSKFVSNVLSHRNNQIEVSSVTLIFRGKVSQLFVQKIMNYAFAHNVQELTIKRMLTKGRELPLFVFSSKSLKHLRLSDPCYITPTSPWVLPALTRLHLSYVTLCGDDTNKFIAKCTNLKNLTLSHFATMGFDDFSICHIRLSNLTLEYGSRRTKVNVVAPQLENLTIIDCSGELLISAPDLLSFVYKGYSSLRLSADGFHSLEKVDLRFSRMYDANADQMVNLLQQFHSAKSLTLNSEVVEFLSSSNAAISHQPSPFANLKNLKFYPLEWDKRLDENVTMSTEVKNYFLENSPSVTFIIVSRKEMRALRDAKRAQELMAELHMLLDLKKESSQETRKRMNALIETHNADTHVQHEQDKPQKAPLAMEKLWGRMKKMNSYWEELMVEIRQGKSKTNEIFSRLSRIKELLPKLPAQRKSEMNAHFSHLCTEADTLMKNIADRKQIQCDIKKRRLNVYFHEPATTPHPSSQRTVPTGTSSTSAE